MRPDISKFLLLLLGTAVLVGCGVPGVPKPPSLELPQPVGDLRAVRKGDRVYLAWTVPTETTDRIPIHRSGPTRICRSEDAAMSDCANAVSEVPAPQVGSVRSVKKMGEQSPARIQANYTDYLPPSLLRKHPGAQIFYAVSVQNERGRSASISNIVSAPAGASVPQPSGFTAQMSAEGVVLSWVPITLAPEAPGLRYLCRIYRRAEGTNQDTVAGEIVMDTFSATQLVDHSFEWEKTYFYRATMVTLIHIEAQTEIQFEGDDTPSIKIFAHDVFPPAVPSGLQAAFSGVGQQPFIDLIWAPDTDADLAGYNVFRHEENGEPTKINSELVITPAFRDTNVVSGKNYFYSVSAEDVRGNKSALSQNASEAVP
jgi:hypothetical protein